MNIVEFLEARIAEDEDAAKAADSGRWLAEGKGVTFEFYGDEFPEGEAQSRLVSDTNANMNHIANWNPARVLAECAAKRAIIGMHRKLSDPHGDEAGDICSMCTETGPEAQGYPCATLNALAAVYKDHPDYQEAWDHGDD